MATHRGQKSTDTIFDDPLWSDWLFWLASAFALLGGINEARKWTGPIIWPDDAVALGASVILGVTFGWVFWGVLPGWIRRSYRRRRSRRAEQAQTEAETAGTPPIAADGKSAPPSNGQLANRSSSEADYLIEAGALDLELDDARLLAMGYELRDAAEIGDLASRIGSLDADHTADELRGLARIAVRTLPPSWKR